MQGQLTKFELFKRRLYLWILPIIILSIISSYINWQGNVSIIDLISLLFLIWFSTSWILIFFKKVFRIVELVTLGIVSISHLISTYMTVLWVDMKHIDSMSGSSYWTTLIFVYIFITLKGKYGVIYSVLLWILTFGIALFYWTDLDINFRYSFVQYMVSNIVYILFLFSARKIIRTYTESELLEKLAYQDTLTGIGNRRQLHVWLEQLIDKNETYLSVIFFDIDHFKKINDQFGHLAGDQVLVEFTTLIKENLKPADHFGRWGGEEFVIITNQSLPKTVLLAEYLKNIIEEHCFSKVGNVTSSFGVATIKADDNPDTLLDRADSALYLAKEEGRNRVKVMSEN